MSLLEDSRAEMLAAKREYGGFLYNLSGTWTRTQNGKPRSVTCRFGVSDPDRLNRSEVQRAQALADSLSLSYADLRVVKVHPDDKEPSTGMTLAEPFDGGRLEIVARSQKGKLSLQRTLTAVVRRGP